MKTLLLGGTGFIGQHTNRTLSQSGREVICINRKDKIETIDDFKRVLAGVDEVVDMAYSSVPKTSFTDPVKDIVENLPRSVNLLAATHNSSVKRLIIISTGGAIYGNSINVSSEFDKTNPMSPYGITKLAVEKYALMYHQIIQAPVIIIRPSNAYGPFQYPFRGQGIIATAFASALLGKNIDVYGGDAIVRDYLFVEDLANAIHLALDHGKIGEVYNVGTGIGITTNQLLQSIQVITRKSGFPLGICPKDCRPFDALCNILNSDKIKSDIGWYPKTALNDGLQETWNWFCQHPEVWK